jgi:hypothetical protein
MLGTPCIIWSGGNRKHSKNKTWDSHGQQPISHRESSNSNADQSVWDLWCTKWHWEEVSLHVLQFPPVDTIPTQLYRHHTVSAVRVLVKYVKTKAGSNFRMQNVKCSPLRLFCDVRWRSVRKWVKTHSELETRDKTEEKIRAPSHKIDTYFITDFGIQ